MSRRLSTGLFILIMVLTVTGCGISNSGNQQQAAQQQNAATEQDPKTEYLKPVAQGTPLADARKMSQGLRYMNKREPLTVILRLKAV